MNHRQAHSLIQFSGSLAIFALAGCASFHAASEVQKGLRAIINGQPEAAVRHFKSVAKRSLQFRLWRSLLQESI